MDEKRPLTDKEKDVLARAITYYYDKHIRGELSKTDNSAATQEHFDLRDLCKRHGIWELLDESIHRGN